MGASLRGVASLGCSSVPFVWVGERRDTMVRLYCLGADYGDAFRGARTRVTVSLTGRSRGALGLFARGILGLQDFMGASKGLS